MCVCVGCEVVGGVGCDAFTEEVLSGWRSPLLPRLSARTQTAPEEEEGEEDEEEGEEERTQGRKRKDKSFTV